MDGLWPSKPKEAVRYRYGAPIFASLTQWVECLPYTQEAGGSIPSGRTISHFISRRGSLVEQRIVYPPHESSILFVGAKFNAQMAKRVDAPA